MKIELNEEEIDLEKEIEFDALKLRDHIHAQTNGELVSKLTQSLLDREGIPEHRLKTFTDDSYATGRGPSPWKQFQRNNNDKDKTLRHPHFLDWLYYFINGPKLPHALIEDFGDFVDELGHVTSSDYTPLAKRTRELVREYNIKKLQRDEIFKLALEFEIPVDWAHSLRGNAMSAMK